MKKIIGTWTNATLGDFITLQRGFDITKKEQTSGKYPVISSSGINSFHDHFKVKGPGVIIGRKGTLGTAFFTEGPYWPHDTTLWVKDFRGNDPKFIFYLLKKLPLEKLDSGSANPTLNRNFAHKIKIKVPNLSSQQKIAKVLSDLDAKIDLNDRINAELEAMAKLVYEYWFVQFDFPISPEQAEMMGDPTLVGKPYKSSAGKMVWNEALNREIPEGWRSATADEIFDFNPSLSIPKGSLAKYLDMNSIPQKGFMTLEPEVKEFNGGVKFQNGDVVVARITPCLENGKTGLITQLEGNEAGFGSTEFIVIRGKKMALSGFASFLARSDSFRNFAIGNMTGTSGRKRVDAKTLKDYILPIPGSETLKEFEAFTSSIFQKQTINIKQNQQLSSLRDWLLPMLMNGQVTVAEAEERVEEELGMVAEERERYGKRK